MISGLRVNFYKSNICGINVSDWSMNAASTFLYRGTDNFPFKFLGVMVRDCLRRVFMWKDLLRNLRNILFSWNEGHLSSGGRVMLINSC